MQDNFTAAHIEFQKNVKAWLFCVTLLFASRVLFVLMLSDRLPDSWQLSDLLIVFRTGLIVDGKVAMHWMIAPFILGMAVALFQGLVPQVTLLRHALIIAFTLATPLLSFGMVGYYQEFNDVFTEFMFEIVNDDAVSVILTMVHEYALLPKLATSLLLSTGFYLAYRRWFTGEFSLLSGFQQQFNSLRVRWIAATICVLFCVLTIRGSLGSHPFQRANTAISKHRFLNKAVYNPYFALHYAYKERRIQSSYTLLAHRYSKPDAHKAIALLSEDSTGRGNIESTDVTLSNSALIRTARGAPNGAPSHIFLLFLESYDAWPFLDKYNSLNVVPYGRRFARSGCYVRSFLPAANSSVMSYTSTINGLLKTNPLRQQELPTSLTHVLKRLGYTTRNIGGFASSWQRFEEHTMEQGFDEFYSTDQLKPGGELPGGQLLDRTLFELVESKLDFSKPTFNVIRSSSYHGPYQVDLEKEGCEIPRISPELRQICDGDVAHLEKIYGHLKYTDMAMGRFVEQMEKRYPRSLFVITGDHFCRRFLNHNPNVFERSAVPLILYGKEILNGRNLPREACGSHIDIAATVIELSAPTGFKYVAVGRDLFQPHSNQRAIGTDFVIVGNHIVSLGEPASVELLPWVENAGLSDGQAMIDKARLLHESYHGLGFHLAKNALEHGVPAIRVPAQRNDNAVHDVARRSARNHQR